ncbi:type I restriction endonuclease [Methylotuvimicrobium alcaliphilum]|uniref:type I site-specific deoxyribonuclease n=1 Tax=Methylotuvimicrobium alcaliphilum (strain DSM 19304 / NCIMB 14124 / VKM B-2133 / 20Z) TaxID=1091494 RepID=G4SWY0_META2|nr:type I restriction endonuclease [Methylotuvimicrobium alcaliphilum]CCE22046.1 protein of unknown function [Methylotuvimicrobium alcaliphilum 20Z]
MAMTEQTQVQEVTAEYLLNELKWDDSVMGLHERLGREGDLGRLSEQEVILTRYLGEKLIELNPGLPEAVYQEALRIVTALPTSTNIVAINKENYALHKNGVEVSFLNDKGDRVKKRLRLFDFETYENNHFLLVREFWIKGDIYRRRADLVGFVNGIPLLFMEVKNVHKDIRAAYEQNLADKHVVEQKLAKLMMQNPLRTDYQEHYERLVKEYNQEKDRVVIEKTFEALLKLNDELSHEEKRAVREGLNEESLVLFDLLSKPNLQPIEIAKIKKVAAALLSTLKTERLRVANWQQKESTRDAVKQQIFDFLYDEKTGLPVEQYADDEIGVITEKVFMHVFRAYTQLPSPYYI